MVSGKIYFVDQNFKNKIGYIYKISDINNTKNYYGSTIKNLNYRFSKHKTEYKCKKIRSSVKEIFDEFGIDNCKIELIEMYPYNDKKELREREGLYIKNNECVNKRIPGRNRTNKEYYQHNKECRINYLREWRKKNNEYHKIWYQKRKQLKENI